MLRAIKEELKVELEGVEGLIKNMKRIFQSMYIQNLKLIQENEELKKKLGIHQKEGDIK